MGRLLRLASAPACYASIAWWGLVGPKLERETLVVHQAAVLGSEGVLLSVRGDLRGWELPGGNALPDESGEEAVRREVLEETGIEVTVERCVGEYHREGFRPHVARVYRCRRVGGQLRPSAETPEVRWFDPLELPTTFFPWYRGPLADALAPHREPLERHEHQGVLAILSAIAIDLRMRWRRPE